MPSASPTRRPADADLEAFADALGEFMRAVRRARGRYAASQPPGEISLSQFHLLDTLAAAGRPLPVSELALGAGVAAPTATRMLGGLEEEGLVVRERSAEDRRVVHVVLTDAGHERIEAKRVAVHEWRREVFASLTPAERRQAAVILERLAVAMEGIG